ncbi:hypothetical protein [Tautonia sociabilis]|uniref:Uncharacterized protein n=1 Tax=Tautonia sociabilis TaxID=2080755 RepID=A0A432MCZ7_9BACT|nr:hypothetical protein [Tautonia sociabilis]RUL81296.1 hypothetical protein TsocGM_25305 [Tautonia sociabilis]
MNWKPQARNTLRARPATSLDCRSVTPPVTQRRLELVEMLGERSLAMVLKRVDQAGPLLLRSPDQFAEQRLSRGFVCRQGNATEDAVPVGVLPVPLLGLPLDPGPGLRVAGRVGRLEETRYRVRSW